MDLILLSFCAIIVLIAAFILLETLKELDAVAKNVKSLNLRIEEIENKVGK